MGEAVSNTQPLGLGHLQPRPRQALPRRFRRAGAEKRPQSRPRKPVFRRLGPKLVPADPGRTRRPGGRLGSRRKRKRRVGPHWRRPEGLFPPFCCRFSHFSPARSHLLPPSPPSPANPARIPPPCRRRNTPCRAPRRPRRAPLPNRNRGSRGRLQRSRRACRTPNRGWKFSGEKQSPPTGGTGR